jgi:DNA-directed RNA polymerase specialized sigma24 family protein
MTVSDRIAEWMSIHGRQIAECARDTGIPYGTAKTAWKRIRRRFGRQAT